MLKRTISGSVYVALVAGFFLLRQFADYRLFSIFIWFFCAVGTFEVSRAIKSYTDNFTFALAVTAGFLFVPEYAIFNYLLFPSYGYLAAFAFLLLIAVIFAVYSLITNRDLKFFGIAILPVLYPALLLLTTLISNDLSPTNKGFLSTLLIFVISPLSDTFAYLVGMTYNKIRKGKAKKMCPKLSPKKTWAGAIGGIIGGVVGALLVYFIFGNITKDLSLPLYIFVLIGIGASVLTEIGDLFESGIKRKVQIKDMGNIMPGHGGVMDRIDGMSFASVLVAVIFLLV